MQILTRSTARVAATLGLAGLGAVIALVIVATTDPGVSWVVTLVGAVAIGLLGAATGLGAAMVLLSLQRMAHQGQAISALVRQQGAQTNRVVAELGISGESRGFISRRLRALDRTVGRLSQRVDRSGEVLIRQISQWRREMGEAQRTSGHPLAKFPAAPSFRYKLDENRRTKRWPVEQLFDKEQIRRTLHECGVAVPRLLKTVSGCASLGAEDLPAAVVVKPTRGHSEQGVVALVSDGDHWRDLISGSAFTLADLRIHLEKERARHQLPDGWLIEELLRTPEGGLPNDYKVYAFRGQLGLILVRSGGNPHRYRWLDADLREVEVGKDWYLIDHDLPPPNGETLDAVARVSGLLAVPFVRVDVFEMPNGPVFGELTPYPGFYDYFNSEWDERLGRLYEEAEASLIIGSDTRTLVDSPPSGPDQHRGGGSPSMGGCE